MQPVSSTPLFKSDAFINGEWAPASSARRFDVHDPATGRALGSVADCDASDMTRAVDAAHASLPAWRALLARDRSRILRAWYDLIVAHRDDLARIMTAEQGKPFKEAQGEIIYGANFVEWYAEEAKRVYGETIPTHNARARVVVMRQGVGVVGAITPWNFPSSMITRKVAPALAAGCTVVIKPSEETPYSALALAQLAAEAGFPKGVLNIVPGTDAGALGGVLCDDARVRKISFTGSTRVGRILMRQAAQQVKRLSLELGGNAAFIVFEDADLDAAADGLMASKFRNNGQTCVCANRVFVHEDVRDALVARITQRMAVLKVGNGFDDGVTIGPLINRAAAVKVQDHVNDAVAHGARLVAGGHAHPQGPLFFEPTLLDGATPAMRVASEEIFGPVLPLFPFRREADVIALANGTESGLAAYFYTRDMGRAWRVAEALEAGIVSINEGVFSTEAAPFGGVKQSGLGREGGHQGLDEYLDVKYVLMGGIDPIG